MEEVVDSSVMHPVFRSLSPSKNRKRRHSDNEYSDDDGLSPKSHSPSIDDDRRAHHNELERRRRDHIKDHFMSLKDAIPLLEGEKSSRALILKRAVEYISLMQSKLNENQLSLEELKRRNEMLEAKLMERGADIPSPTATVSPIARYSTVLPTTSSQIMPLVLPQFKPTLPLATSVPQLQTVPTSSSLQSLDTLRLNTILAPSGQENLLALTHALLNQAVSKSGTEYSSLVPDLHSRLLASSLAIRERQLAAAVRF